MTLQALLDNGDQVLIPAPDYPLWTACTSLAGGTPVHYLCDETAGLAARHRRHGVEDHRPHQGDRGDQPEQPHRCRLQPGSATAIADLARKHQLLLLSDEIYDKILYDDAKHIATASVAPDRADLDLQRSVEGLPGGRLPVGLAGDHRPQGARREFHRGHQPVGEHAAVP